MQFRSMVWLLTAVALIGSATSCQSGGKQRGDDPTLEALVREPVATLKLPGGKVVVDVRAEAITGGKSIPARILRVFAFGTPARARAGRTAAVNAAVADGWDITRGPRPTALFGAKTLASGPAMLVIQQYNEDGIDKVSIRLEHIRCPSTLCG